ncbi:RIO1-domain-containing protein [Massarina eburnea CBS 473.64]|uniref:Serine/threonine-protein kinase RIO1 n=1 Tax=Massarina eburnea CBS 473.64 TaxID=1395130 RepID=A0A6A6RKJ5_9PLEO|nr:RIO1-domain-containing protein [Massarina eburnea CBS 473.64]
MATVEQKTIDPATVDPATVDPATEESDESLDDLFYPSDQEDDAPELVDSLNPNDYTKSYNRQRKLNDSSVPDDQKPKTNTQPKLNTQASVADQITELSKHASKIKLEGFNVGESRKRDKSDRATREQVLDPRTRMILYQLLNRDIISEINGVISTGKEANVYHAVVLPDDALPAHRAVKVYKTAILAFKDRSRYVNGDYRFNKGGYNKGNGRSIVQVWAEKEFRNLKRIHSIGIPCPEPLYLRQNVLVMGFVGDKKGHAAPRLRDVTFSALGPEEEEQKYKDLYVQLLTYMRIMYHSCRLVHGDLSEYNVLYHEDKLIMIDVSQSVEHDHPRSLEFLRVDIKNVSDFFRSHNVEVLSERNIFKFITGEAGGKESPEIALSIEKMFQVRAALTDDQQRAENEDDEVFRSQYIPQNLNEVYDIERDGELLNSGKRGDLIYQGLLADKLTPASQNESDASASGSGDEDSEHENDDDADFVDKGPARGKKNMDKDEKAAHKKAVKEEKREKRKEKLPKHLKNRLVKTTAKRK